MQKIRKGDQVQIIRGSERPQTADDAKKASGEVLAVYPRRGKCIVAGRNLVWKHKRGTGPENPGGRKQVEAEVPLASVMYFDTQENRADAVGFKAIEGKRVRYLKTSGRVIG